MFFILIVTIAILSFICYRFLKDKTNAKNRKLILSNWGKEKIIYRDYEKIALYHQLISESTNYSDKSISDKTYSDLNIESVFNKIDRCNTKAGQQFLYHTLLCPLQSSEELLKKGASINNWTAKPNDRIEAEIILGKLNKKLSYSFPNIIFTWPFSPSKWGILNKVLALLPLLFFLLFFINKVFGFFVFGSLILNLFLHYKNKKKIDFFFNPFTQLRSLKNSANKINSSFENISNENVKIACQKIDKLDKYQILMDTGKTSHNEFSAIAWLFLEYIKIFFLIEVNMLDTCIRKVSVLKNEILLVFEFVGEVDSNIAIASYRTSLSEFCEPNFSNAPVNNICAVDLYHPLIDNCVKNSIDFEGKGVLITGSNMSGKTTFIRSVALNVLLAQTIFTVLAKSYRACFNVVNTSINISDDINTGKSYYIEEIASVYSFVELSRSKKFNNLFVMDELFKGTNTVERVGAAFGVLEYLNSANNLTLISTHDIELATLLKDNYNLYHFEESVIDDQLFFDHLIKPGVLKTRNAIKLLSVYNYPEIIINNYFQCAC